MATAGPARTLLPRGRRDPLVLWSGAGVVPVLVLAGLAVPEEPKTALGILLFAGFFVVLPAALVVGLAAAVMASTGGKRAFSGVFAVVGLGGALVCALSTVSGLMTDQETGPWALASILAFGGAGVALGLGTAYTNLVSARSGERFARGLRWFAVLVRMAVVLWALFGAAIFFPVGPFVAVPFAIVCLLAVRRTVRAERRGTEA